MPGPIFISHSEHDKAFADAILKALEDLGIKCWIAPRDIRPGGSYADAILTAIENCSLFVLIYSDHCNKSGHVLREVERALNFEKNIVPVRFDTSVPSRSLDYLLATVHWLTVPAESRGPSVKQAAMQIAGCLPPLEHKHSAVAIEPSQLGSGSPVAPRKTIRRDLKVIWLSLTLVLLGALVCLGFIFIDRLLQRSPVETATISTVPNPSATPVASASASPSVSAEPSPSRPIVPSVGQVFPQANAPATAANEPQETLRRYFACFKARDAPAAYNCLSAKFRARLSFKKYSETFASTREIRLIEARQMSGTADSATIETVLEETDADSRLVQWRGPISLVRESGVWRIETLKGLKSLRSGETNLAE